MYIYIETKDDIAKNDPELIDDYMVLIPNLAAFVEIWPANKPHKRPLPKQKKAYNDLKKEMTAAKIYFDEYDDDDDNPICSYVVLFVNEQEYGTFLKLIANHGPLLLDN